MLKKNNKLFNNQAGFTQDNVNFIEAIEENTLSEYSAIDSKQDWTDEEPFFLEDDGVFLEPPTFITRAKRDINRDDSLV